MTRQTHCFVGLWDKAHLDRNVWIHFMNMEEKERGKKNGLQPHKLLEGHGLKNIKDPLSLTSKKFHQLCHELGTKHNR